MEMSMITKQIIGFQKTMFENTYNGLTVLQDCSQNMMEGYIKQLPWMNDEHMKPFEDSFEFLKKARREYKDAVDQGFVKLEEMTCGNAK